MDTQNNPVHPGELTAFPTSFHPNWSHPFVVGNNFSDFKNVNLQIELKRIV